MISDEEHAAKIVQQLEMRRELASQLREEALRADRAEAGLKAQDWQPIATAPKDGTRILFAFPNGNVAEARYLRHAGRFNVGGKIATHWRPMPEAPEIKSRHSVKWRKLFEASTLETR